MLFLVSRISGFSLLFCGFCVFSMVVSDDSSGCLKIVFKFGLCLVFVLSVCVSCMVDRELLFSVKKFVFVVVGWGRCSICWNSCVSRVLVVVWVVWLRVVKFGVGSVLWFSLLFVVMGRVFSIILVLGII